ncbi:MAG: hypothetical protein K0Q94_4524 [Paenibacillus sp.]|nr:hypothetical protein [Paenibacillus sp.]
MSAPLRTLRYMLILVPSIAGLYGADVPSYPVYCLLVLLLLWLVQLRLKGLDHPAQPLLLWLEIAFVGWIGWMYDGGIMYLLPLSTLISVFDSRVRIRFALPSAAMLILFNAAIASYPIGTRLSLNTVFAAWAVVLHGLRSASMGLYRLESFNDELRRKHYELEEARNTIADYAAKVENLAQVEERNRISRDIHDELGHRLVRLKMMMDAACAIIPAKPDKGFELVRQVRDQLADSMEILRSTVRNMKPDETERLYSLAALVEDLGKTNGIRLEYVTEGMPRPLYPSEEIVLYRNAQEAVTNAIRHGGADTFLIRLRFGDRSVAMTVSNNGDLPAAIRREGLGISGMEERVKLLGGSLSFEMSPQFAVTTFIPRHRKPTVPT